MKLRALTVRRMPGIDRSFHVEDLADGLNLVVGPNGSGKTTLCRAVRALLWPEEVKSSPVSATSAWDDEGTAVRVEREEGRLTWQRDGMAVERPELPAGHFARCFTLGVRDLLLEERATDAAIASEIRNQMSGGFDIGALLDGSFAERQREGQAEDRKIRELQDRVRELRSEGAALAEREDSKRDLEKERDEAREATKRLELLGTARKVTLDRAALKAVQGELAGLPPGMERIRGGEDGQLEQVESDLDKAREKVANCRRSIEDAERTIEAARLPGGAPDEAELKAWLDRARELQRLEGEIVQAEESRVKAEARRENTLRVLADHGTATPQACLGPEELTKIELFLPKVDHLRAQRVTLEADRRRLGEEKEDPGASWRQIERGIEALEGWLSADELRRRVRTGWMLPAALVALLAGAAAGLMLHWSGWVFCGAGLGGLLALLWIRTRIQSPDQDRRVFEAPGLEAPATWEPENVRERLHELRVQEEELRREEGRAELRSDLEGKLNRQTDAEAELEAERKELRTVLGVDPGSGDIGLAVLAGRVRAYHEADEEHGTAVARLGELGARRAELLEWINRFLRGAGLEEGADAAESIRRLEDLKDRVTTLLEAQRERETEAVNEAEQCGRVEELERRREEIFREAGLEPGEHEGLLQRVRGLDRFRDLRRKEDRYRDVVEEGRSALAGRDDLLDRSLEELDTEMPGLETLASRTDALSEQIGSIEEAVNKARGDDRVQRKMAELAGARDRLADRLEARLERAAGAFLLEGVLAEYDRATQPEVLTRAVELFARFTRHEYELRLDPRGGAAGFRAVELSSGEGRSLSELSDGTRVQLLLAARLAYATRADRRKRVPFFLDEVLTTSDPVRFAAVARSLLVLVREEGRQVFYLTSNPADAARWAALLEPEERERMRTVDLAELRRLAGAATEVGEVEVEPLPEPPSPEGLSSGEYGLAIGAPPLEPHRPVEGLHLFHLLHDDLELLHRLLLEGVSTLGQWRSLINLGQAARLAGEERMARLSSLGDLARVFFETWSIGRGRPVDADALRRADGVSGAFRDRLVELAAELDGEAARLVRILEERGDERVSGFREKKLEEFRNWLIGEGYLDLREPLEEPALEGRVLEALAAHLRAGRLSPADVAAHVHRLFRLANRSGGK